MDVVSIDLKVNSFFDTENNYWVVKSEKYKVSGSGKTLKEAKEKLSINIKKLLEPNQLKYAQRINQLEDYFREIRGQLLTSGFEKNSIIINCIDLVVNKNHQLNQGFNKLKK